MSSKKIINFQHSELEIDQPVTSTGELVLGPWSLSAAHISALKVLEHLNIPILVIDGQELIILANPKICLLLGFEKENDLIGCKLKSLFEGDNSEYKYQLFSEHIHGNPDLNKEIMFNDEAGALLRMKITSVPLNEAAPLGGRIFYLYNSTLEHLLTSLMTPKGE